MGVCKIGGHRLIRGQRYRKEIGACNDCAFFSGTCPNGNSATTWKALDSGGTECYVHGTGTIWMSAPSYKPPTKAHKKPPKPHTWSKKLLSVHPKSTKAKLVELLMESVNEINQLGTENAALKNQLAALRRKTKKGEA